MDNLSRLEKEMVHCERCPRLRKYCLEIAKNKKREFKDEPYWGHPVPSFGDPNARIFILGLAPAAHGANRTGRMFTGDSSGRWLYKALHRVGLASQETSTNRKDGLVLNNVYISATAHCAPPDNKPTPKEIANCSSYLEREYHLLKKVRLYLALGNIGYQAILRLLAGQGVALPRPKVKFQHNGLIELGDKRILMSYHPSRQNTQTGKLTEKMWNSIFERAIKLV